MTCPTLGRTLRRALHRLPSLVLTAALAAATGTAAASPEPAKKPAAAPAKKPAPSASRKALENQAKGLALATTTVEQITAGQLDVANRVLTGTADCEFRQQVQVQPMDGHPGHFRVSHQARHFTMVPQETSTGAVRLEDRHAGVVWLQIPAKSMLMDAKRGQRLVDACQHAEQRAAVQAAAAAPAPAGLGIANDSPTGPAATSGATAGAAASPPTRP